MSFALPLVRSSIDLLLATMLAWTMQSAAAFAQQLDGERLFQQRCAACHSLDQAQKRPSVHLSGVIGRAAGSVDGIRFSEALRNTGIVWDAQSLDAFLAAPRQRVPGTQMTVSVPDPNQRAAIVAFLTKRP